jgi:hypothetical protein
VRVAVADKPASIGCAPGAEGAAATEPSAESDATVDTLSTTSTQTAA